MNLLAEMMPDNTTRSSFFIQWLRRNWLAMNLAFALVLAPGVVMAQTAAANFDIRTDNAATSRSFMDRLGARRDAAGVQALVRSQQAGLTRLRTNFQIDVVDAPETGTPEVISARPGSRLLTGPGGARADNLRAHLSAYADAYGLTQNQVRDLVVAADYLNPGGNMGWAEFEQRINGLPVFRGMIRGGFTANGELARTTGQLAAGLDERVLPSTPRLSAARAVSLAAADVGWNLSAGDLLEKLTENGRITFARGPLADDSKTWLLYFPLAPGVARLAWACEIWGDPDAFMVVVDAEDGTVLFRKNMTESERQQTPAGPVSVAATPVENPWKTTVRRSAFADLEAGPSGDTSSLLPGVDFQALRAFLKTAAGTGGIEVGTAVVGQTVFFHVDLQVWGTGVPVTLAARALLDGSQYCTLNGAVVPGNTYFGQCSTGWVVTAGPHTLQWELDYTATVAELDEANNTATRAIATSALTSDIVAGRSYMKTATAGGGLEVLDVPRVGETVFFHGDWLFPGSGAATTINSRALLDGVQFCTNAVSVAPSATTPQPTSCATGWVVTAGAHTLQWEFDHTTTVTEQNESNNSTTLKSFTPATTQGTQPATYLVYNDDSPAPMSPSTVLPGAGTQGAYITRTSQTLIGNEAPYTFNTLGWIKDGANVTDGNNVEAGIDRDYVDGVDAPVTGVGRVFDFSYDPETTSPLVSAFQNGEVTDMFYWTNIYHDRLYLLGFTEAARNFQNDNFGRGGAAADRVRAEAQDLCSLTVTNCSSPANNANFSTPSDGGRGRMQMYIFPGPNPARTSALEHDVLLHELTHGTSNRLHSNASGLTTAMSRGMGEGWSDFYARALLSTAGEDPNGIYSTGPWVTYLLATNYTDNYYYGIRRFPYAVRSNVGTNGKPHNPLTFADIDAVQINTADGAFPRNPIISNSALEVHNVGEVWCMALLEVRARYINRLGFAVGNQRFMQFVTDGMKLDPVNPTLLQGRDSIIAAANAGGGTAEDIRDIWIGFAIRGMGYSAQVLNVAGGRVVESFDVPWMAAGSGTVVSESIPNGSLDPGETAVVSLCLTNSFSSGSNAVTGTLFAGGGVTLPGGSQSYGVIPPSSSVCRNFTFTVSAACGSTVNATFQAQEAGGATTDVQYTFQVGAAGASLLAENFDTVTAPALPAGWSTSTLNGTANLWVSSVTTPDTPPNKMFTGNPGTTSDNVLVGPAVAMPAASRATFRNFYNTEPGFDGGVLEISIAAGAFQDIVSAGGSFISGGYNGTITTDVNNPLSGRPAWTGAAGAYVTTTVLMPPAAAGQNVAMRWRMGSDNVISAAGWSIDSLSMFAMQCGVATARKGRGQIISN